MEILLISNPQANYSELSSLPQQLMQQYPGSPLKQVQYQTVVEASQNMDPSISRIALFFTKSISNEYYETIMRALKSANCDIIIYPQALSQSSSKDIVTSGKSDIMKRVKECFQNHAKVENTKSIRMIGIKQTINQDLEKSNWNSIGFNVLRSKDVEFNKQMNMIFFKYKNNNNIKFKQIKQLGQIPSVLKQKQILIVCHSDLKTIQPKLNILQNRIDKVFKVLFNTSTKMAKSNPLFDLNANKLSVVQFQINNYLEKLKPEENLQKYNELKSKININSQIPVVNQMATSTSKVQNSVRPEDLSKLFILNNNNPKFKNMYQNLQTEGTVINNLQHQGLRNGKVILLAPYEIKNVLVSALASTNTGINVVLYDSTGGRDMMDGSSHSRITYVGKTPEQIKSFLKNKVKFNDTKLAVSRTVKFIEDQPSGTSIDKSLMMNKQNSSQMQDSNLQQPFMQSSIPQQWTVKLKPNVQKFITFPTNQQQQFMNPAGSGAISRSMRKMTTKKKTMVGLIDRQPSIQVIQSQNQINIKNPNISNNQAQNQYFNNQINTVIVQSITKPTSKSNLRSNKNIGEYNDNIQSKTKIEGGINKLPSANKVVSVKFIQEEFDETVISIRNPKKKKTVVSQIENAVAEEFKQQFSQPPPVSSYVQQNYVSSNAQPSSQVHQSNALNMTSHFGDSMSFAFKPQPSMTYTKNIDISIKPSPSKIKQDKQVIQIMSTHGAPATKTLTTSPTPSTQVYSVTSQKHIQPIKVTRSASVDPSFMDQKYQRIYENGLTKYVLKQSYKDQMIRKMLHQDANLNPVLHDNRHRVFSVERNHIQRKHSPNYQFTQYYQNMKPYESPHRVVSVNKFYERPTTVKMNKRTSRIKENYSPSYTRQHTQYQSNFFVDLQTRSTLYLIPSSRQTLLQKIKQIASKNDTVRSYSNQQQLSRISFEDYKTVYIFPKDENRQNKLSKSIPNCFTVKLSKHSKIFNNKQLFVQDVRDLLKRNTRVQSSQPAYSSTKIPKYNSSPSKSLLIVPQHLLDTINKQFGSHSYSYSSTQSLYDILQKLKSKELIVVIQDHLSQFIEQFSMPSTTSFVVYNSDNGNIKGLVRQIKKLM